MLRRFLVIGLCALAVACQSQKDSEVRRPVPSSRRAPGSPSPRTSSRPASTSSRPFIRARYSTLERKKEFLDNLVRFEVLAREAEKQGLATDPDVQLTLKKIMVQKLVQKNFQDPRAAKDAARGRRSRSTTTSTRPTTSARKRVRVAAVVWNAPAGSPGAREEARRREEAALAKIKAEEKKNAARLHAGGGAALRGRGHEGRRRRPPVQVARGARRRRTRRSSPTPRSRSRPGETSGVVETPKGALPPEAHRPAGGAEPLLRPGEDADREQALRARRRRRSSTSG